MRMHKVLIAIAALMLSGCVTTDAKPHRNISEACQISGMEAAKFTAVEPAIAEHAPSHTDRPDKAEDAHVNGCASYAYMIDKNGNPKNARVLIESPKGYGFGQTALSQLKHTKFEPPAKPDQWYWTVSSWHLGE
jgi:TonB family protein